MLQKWKKRWTERGAEANGCRRAGITLVETMVSVMLLMILMTMVVGIVSPAFKIFIQMQKLQFSQMILDNVVEDVQDTVREARTYVKIYAKDGGSTDCVADETGIGTRDVYGSTLEYLNESGKVVLVSTGGCAITSLYYSKKLTGSFSAVERGQLLYRYYDTIESSVETEDAAKYQYYYFNDSEKTTPIARTATTAFGSGYYMGNYLKVEFAFPPSDTEIANGTQVTRLKARASLYSDKDMTNLVVSEEFVIDLRYKVVCEKKKTAISTPASFSTSGK